MISNDGTVKIFGNGFGDIDDDDNLIINDGTCGNVNTYWWAELNKPKAKPTTYLLKSLNCYNNFELTMV